MAWRIPLDWRFLRPSARAKKTAGEASLAARLSASNAGEHLACLRECGLVDSRHDWRNVYYRVGAGVEQVADRIAACQRPEMRRR